MFKNRNREKDMEGLFHSKDSCPYTARQIKPSVYKIKDIIYNKENKIPIASFKNKFGYVFLPRYLNKKLFSLLDTSGFWLFHSSNKSQSICSLHQVILYIHKGYHLLLKGYTCDMSCCEIHHLDHDPSNNNKENLVYVSSQENKLMSDVCRFTYNGYIKSASINPFKKDNSKSRIINLIKKTVAATFSRFGLTAPTETSFNWLMSLPQDLGNKIVYTWQHLPHNTKLFINSIYN